MRDRQKTRDKQKEIVRASKRQTEILKVRERERLREREMRREETGEKESESGGGVNYSK